LDMLLAGRAEESAVALVGVQRVEAEMEAIKEMQSKLFSVVEGLSEEMNKVKAAVSGKTQAKMLGVIETLSKELTNTRSAVDELKFANASIAEDMGRLKISIASCELAIKDASAEVRAEARQVDCTELRLRKQVEDSQDRLGEDLASLQRRLVAELRAETVAALQSESDAIARLDKRLWVLDQRVERRLDDLATSGGSVEIACADHTATVQGFTVVNHCQSPQRTPRSPVYSPGWSIIGGRLISAEDRRMSSALRHVTA
jgi:chromosome segregation ATPase